MKTLHLRGVVASAALHAAGGGIDGVSSLALGRRREIHDNKLVRAA